MIGSIPASHSARHAFLAQRPSKGSVHGMAETSPNDAAHPEELTLADQVRGIIYEALEGPGLSDAAKSRLEHLVRHHEGHPEMALLEHLRGLRNADGSEDVLLAG